MKEVFITLFGKVQGVGFRIFAKKVADELGIFGYIENMEDGDVEICAQGEKEDLEVFVDKIRRGPFFANVEDIDIAWSDLLQDTYVDFEIHE